MKNLIVALVVMVSGIANASVEQVTPHYEGLKTAAVTSALQDGILSKKIDDLTHNGYTLVDKVASPIRIGFGDEGFDGTILVTIVMMKVVGFEVDTRTIFVSVGLIPMLSPKVAVLNNVQLK